MSHVVTLPYDRSYIAQYDPMWVAVEWAKENCRSYITNKVRKVECISADGLAYYEQKIDYYFANEGDAVWFALRWV